MIDCDILTVTWKLWFWYSYHSITCTYRGTWAWTTWVVTWQHPDWDSQANSTHISNCLGFTLSLLSQASHCYANTVFFSKKQRITLQL